MNTLLSEDKRESLIELVREQPILYDKSSKLHSCREIRDKIWFEIGRILEADKDVCKQSWKSMRDQYVKSLRLLNKRKTYERRYKYFDAMKFLNDYAALKILRDNPDLKRVTSNFPNDPEEFWIEFDTVDDSRFGNLDRELIFSESHSMIPLGQNESAFAAISMENNNIHGNSNDDSNVNKYRDINEQLLGEVKIENDNLSEDNTLQLPIDNSVDNVKPDRYDQFFLSMASTVREYNLPLTKWCELQCKVIKCVTNELERAGKK